MTVHDDDDSFDLNFMRTLAPAYYDEPDDPTPTALALAGFKKAQAPHGRKGHEMRRRLYRKQRGRCFDCGEFRALTFGHRLPRSLGGGNSCANVIGQCEPCNIAQGDRIHPSVPFPIPDILLRPVLRGRVEVAA